MGPNFVRGALRGALPALIALLFFGTTTEVLAQTGTLRGQVTDAVTMRPLSGAQVSVPGTGRGALANSSGQFLIVNVPAGTRTVRVEIIGYGTQEQEVDVTAGQVVQVNFQLSQSALELDAIVVTGTPGQTQRRAIGNSVSTFQASQVTEAVPVGTVQELLQGRTPGLTLIADGGAAGDGSAIRLRGSGSIEGRFEPVIYVDGIRVAGGTNDFDDQCGSVTHCTDALDFLNPDDIESVEVIKGPAASTLYGAEAAAGVIQIITKKGRSGQSGVQWTAGADVGTSTWALQRPVTYWNCTASQVGNRSYPGCTSTGLRIYEPLDAHPNALRGNDDAPGCVRPEPFSVQSFCAGDSNGAGQYSFNLSARGGGELFNFFVSAERSDEQGVFNNNFARRSGGRANFGFTPSEVLSFDVNVGYTRGHVRMPLANNSSNSILRNGMRGRADAVYQYEPGYRGYGPTLANEWNLQTRSERYTIGATVNYQPFEWFRNRLVVGLDNNIREVRDFTPPDPRPEQPHGTTRSTGLIDYTTPTSHNWTVDYSGTATTDVSENLSSAFSAGIQLNAAKQESFQVTGEGLVNQNLNLVGSAAITRADQAFEEQTSLGFYLQEQVGWKNRLFATAAVRVDDNSAFGRDFSLVVYPKAQLSYVMSDEDYFDVGWVDQLKLRGAWGQAGNPPDPFTADRTFSPGVAVAADGQVVNILRPESYGNPDLKAETGSELELGFESSLYDGRLGVDFTYYRQNTKDALIAVPDPRSSGFSGEHFANVGEIKNTGMELLVTATPVYLRDFQWDATVSLSTNSNELVDFGDAPLTEIAFGSFATVQKHIEGYPLGGFWGITGTVDAQNDVTLGEEEYVGPSLPTREIGLTNTFTIFDDFRLYANLDYKGGHYQWCAICSVRSRFDQNTWTINRPDADPAEVALVTSNQTRRWISEADFIKLREVSLSYRIPSRYLENVGVENGTLTLSGRNLWMWTKYGFDQDGVGLGSPDPEVNFDSRSAYGRTDYASIPMLRTFSASIRVAF